MQAGRPVRRGTIRVATALKLCARASAQRHCIASVSASSCGLFQVLFLALHRCRVIPRLLLESIREQWR